MVENLRLTRYDGPDDEPRHIDVLTRHILCYEPHRVRNEANEWVPVGTKVWIAGRGPVFVNESFEDIRSQIRGEE